MVATRLGALTTIVEAQQENYRSLYPQDATPAAQEQRSNEK